MASCPFHRHGQGSRSAHTAGKGSVDGEGLAAPIRGPRAVLAAGTRGTDRGFSPIGLLHASLSPAAVVASSVTQDRHRLTSSRSGAAARAAPDFRHASPPWSRCSCALPVPRAGPRADGTGCTRDVHSSTAGCVSFRPAGLALLAAGGVAFQ
jgi:hypothetical protein